MSKPFACLSLAISLIALTGCSDTHRLIALMQQQQLPPEAASEVAAMAFDSSPITVHGRVTTAVFSDPGAVGMIIVEAQPSGKYVFSTAPTRDLAKQGLTRFAIQPGSQVVVAGVLAHDGRKLQGFAAARADTITLADGRTLFDRAALRK